MSPVRAPARLGPGDTYVYVAWIPVVPVPATLVLLLFPDGSLPSARWRPVAWCAGLGILGVLFFNATTTEPFPDYPE